MSSFFDKLNLKDQAEIVVIGAPASLNAVLDELEGVAVVCDLKRVKEIHFALLFVTRQVEVDKLAKEVAKKAVGDAVVWFAYPKGTSKNYTCDFNRDTGWDAVRAAGFDSVRMVAIDQDWSALRFRRNEFIRRAK